MIINGGVSPYTQVWEGALGTTEDISGLLIGRYGVTVTDANGCVVEDEFTVNEPSVLLADAEIVSNYAGGFAISCFNETDGSVRAIPSGGLAPYSFLWNDGNTSQINDNLGVGIYEVTITDVNGCTAVSDVELLDPPESIVNASVNSSFNGQHISCVGANDGQAIAAATNGVAPYSYSWSNGTNGPIASNLSQGTLSLIHI